MAKKYRYLSDKELMDLAMHDSTIRWEICDAIKENSIAVVIYGNKQFYFEKVPSKAIRTYLGTKLRKMGYKS